MVHATDPAPVQGSRVTHCEYVEAAPEDRDVFIALTSDFLADYSFLGESNQQRTRALSQISPAAGSCACDQIFICMRGLHATIL